MNPFFAKAEKPGLNPPATDANASRAEPRLAAARCGGVSAAAPVRGRGRLAGCRRSRGGRTLVEAALVLPLVLLLLFGLFEYGRFLMTLHMVNNAAREACRYAVTHTQPVYLGGVTYGNTTTDVTNTFNQFMAGQSLSSQSVTVYLSDTLGNSTGTWTDAAAGQSICVRVTGNYNVLMASLLYLPSTIPFDVKAVMRTEVN